MCSQAISSVQQPKGRSLGSMQLRSSWTVTSGMPFWSEIGPLICSADLLEFLCGFGGGGGLTGRGGGGGGGGLDSAESGHELPAKNCTPSAMTKMGNE